MKRSDAVPAGRTSASRGPRAAAESGTRFNEAFAFLLGTHFMVDCFSSTLPTVQPILGERFSLSLAQAGLLGGLWMFASSVLQLPFGLLSDRLHSRLFTVLSPLVAAVTLCSLGSVSGLWGVAALLLLGGMGVAAYHPHSTSQAGLVYGGQRGFATAVFLTVGTAGLGLGPLYLTAVIEGLGFDRMWVAALPAVAVAPLLLWRVPQPVRDARAERRVVDWRVLRRRWSGLVAHYTLVVLRSIVQVGLAQYLARYMMEVRGADLWSANVALSAYLLSTSAGSALGGAASDRFGGRIVIIGSAILSGPLLALFVATDGWISIAALFVGGVALLSTIPVNVVLAQKLVPSQEGAASALMMGFGWGIAGIVFVPAAGWLGDAFGLEAVFWGFTALPVLGLPIALALRRERAARARAIG